MKTTAPGTADSGAAVTLVALGPEHAAATFSWVSDPVIAANLGLKREATMARTEAWIAAAGRSDDRQAYAILRERSHVGNVVLDLVDPHLGTARLSIYLGEPSARGTGVGRAAMKQVLGEAFGPLGLHKVWLTVHPGNVGALRLYASLGFLVEGLLRDEFILDGRRLPAIRMGLLRSEFGPSAGTEE